MRWNKKEKEPDERHQREVKKFLLIPRTLFSIKHTKTQTRWLEVATILQVRRWNSFDGEWELWEDRQFVD